MTPTEIYDAVVKELEEYGSADFQHLERVCPGQFTGGGMTIMAPPPAENLMVWHGLTPAADEAMRRFMDTKGHVVMSTSTWAYLNYLSCGAPNVPPASSLNRKYKKLHWVPSFIHLDGRCDCPKKKVPMFPKVATIRKG